MQKRMSLILGIVCLFFGIACQRKIATIQVGDGPCAFAWNSIQNRVYLANQESSSISVIRDDRH